MKNVSFLNGMTVLPPENLTKKNRLPNSHHAKRTVPNSPSREQNHPQLTITRKEPSPTHHHVNKIVPQ